MTESTGMGGGRIVESAAVIITVLLVLGACKFGQAVLEPAIFAVFIIEIAWPLQKSLKSRIGKAAALAVTVCVTGGVILALLSLSIWGGRQIVNWITEHIERIQDILLASTSWLEEHDIFVLAMLSDRFDSTEVIRLLQVVAVRVNTILAFALIVLIYVVLGLGEMEILTARVAALKNQDASRHLLSAGARIGVKFRVYMLVRTIASAATGFAVWGFARLMGLEMAGACGVLAFALNYLPYIGSFAITVFLTVFSYVQSGSPETALVTLVGVSFIQFVIGSYLEPQFSGNALSISPPLVLFAIVLWTYLWGGLGAFLGVPLMIAALTLFEEFPSTRWIADILSGGRAGRDVASPSA
jgi:predicted PurR-regulated permease PerM